LYPTATNVQSVIFKANKFVYISNPTRRQAA
jgi:hypothetical protein